MDWETIPTLDALVEMVNFMTDTLDRVANRVVSFKQGQIRYESVGGVFARSPSNFSK
jgi:hypothetical protein